MLYSGADNPAGGDHPNIIEKECRMSVIAKLNLLAVRAFGGGSLYEMSCVCQDDLMAMYAKSDEDKLFTNASPWGEARLNTRSEEHTSELQSLMRISYAVFCLKKKKT